MQHDEEDPGLIARMLGDQMIGCTIKKIDHIRDDQRNQLVIETDKGRLTISAGCLFHETEGYPFGTLNIIYGGAPRG